MKKTTQLRTLLTSPRLDFLLEAHNGLSARIVEESGFHGIWASGLSISASLALRDNNEASWTQVLEVVEFMSDATSVPILLDADTGYGNFNNVRRLVRKLEQRGIAGMCIEDKLFPKSNSFREGRPQPMADMQEFVGKIRSAKDTQADSDFCVVARVEALIAGYGLEEALRRAHAYAEAGADAILIHSKLATAFQVLAFMEHWHEDCPVVIVPTKYHTTPVEEFERAGIRLVIWANHMMRSSITAMQRVAGQIRPERSLVNVEPIIATLDEVFRLQNEDELKRAETVYLPVAAAIPDAGEPAIGGTTGRLGGVPVDTYRRSPDRVAEADREAVA
jgi:phosphoenolpyruvate phosphomutase